MIVETLLKDRENKSFSEYWFLKLSSHLYLHNKGFNGERILIGIMVIKCNKVLAQNSQIIKLQIIFSDLI